MNRKILALTLVFSALTATSSFAQADLGLKNVGYLSTVPLALLLTGFAEVPAVDDPSALLRRKAGC